MPPRSLPGEWGIGVRRPEDAPGTAAPRPPGGPGPAAAPGRAPGQAYATRSGGRAPCPPPAACGRSPADGQARLLPGTCPGPVQPPVPLRPSGAPSAAGLRRTRPPADGQAGSPPGTCPPRGTHRPSPLRPTVSALRGAWSGGVWWTLPVVVRGSVRGRGLACSPVLGFRGFAGMAPEVRCAWPWPGPPAGGCGLGCRAETCPGPGLRSPGLRSPAGTAPARSRACGRHAPGVRRGPRPPFPPRPGIPRRGEPAVPLPRHGYRQPGNGAGAPPRPAGRRRGQVRGEEAIARPLRDGSAAGAPAAKPAGLRARRSRRRQRRFRPLALSRPVRGHRAAPAPAGPPSRPAARTAPRPRRARTGEDGRGQVRGGRPPPGTDRPGAASGAPAAKPAGPHCR